MSTHKFKVGISVFLQLTNFNREALAGPYQVTKQLPERDGEFEYLSNIQASGIREWLGKAS